MSAPVLVLGATGTVGAEVVRSLESRGARVRAMVRSPERAALALPASVELVAGELGDRAAIERAIAGVRSVFYVSPHEVDEEAHAGRVIGACEDTRVRLVFLGVHVDGASRLRRAALRLAYSAMFPHYSPKFRISERVRGSRADAVVLVATNFFQNDALLADRILAGSYDLPLCPKGVNRVDVRDIADAAARALTDPSVASGAHPVVGPASLTGLECAAAWARALGRDVRYAGDDFERFAGEAKRRLDGKKRDDFLASFRLLRRFAVPTDPRQLEATAALLGRAPRTYDAYVAEAAGRWRSEGRRAA